MLEGGWDVQKATTFVEICGMTLLTLGGAVLLIAPAAQLRAALARRLHRV
jgi:hypothetical protein